MASQREHPTGTYTAGEAVGAHIRVKLDGTSDRQVVIAGAGERGIGVTQQAADSGAEVEVREWSAGGTIKMTAGAAVSTRNAALYAAAAGKVSTTVSAALLGWALDTASAAGSVIEALPDVRPLAATVAAIDDNTGGTTGGTEQLADPCTAITQEIAEGTLGGTTGGTASMVIVRGTGYSGGPVADIQRNLQVLTAAVNNSAVEVTAALGLINNNFAVVARQINAMRTALRSAGIMQ